MNKRTKLFFIFLACGMLCQAEDGTKRCEPGTFLYTALAYLNRFFCIECPDGTFMPDNNHQNTSCRLCNEIREPQLEILISPCNKTHDAVIHCVDGYYRDEARNPRETGHCRKCTQCKFAGQPCSTYKDTVCCWDENYDVVSNHDGVPVCIERPWFCRRGQYFDTRAYYCLPCPENTFMNLDYHIQPSCLDCREFKPYRPLHSVIIQPCNSTHAPVIKCEDGFFIKPNMGYRDDATGCSPCTDCSTKTDVQYEGRKCDGMEDTVCCPEAYMTVHDTPEGPVCCPQANMIVVNTPEGQNCTDITTPCPSGLCLSYGSKESAPRCSPCLFNAHLAEVNNTGTSNKPSSADNDTADVKVKEGISHQDSVASLMGASVASFVLGILLTLIIIFITAKKGMPRFPRRRLRRTNHRSATGTEHERHVQLPLLPTNYQGRRVSLLVNDTPLNRNKKGIASKRTTCTSCQDKFISTKEFDFNGLPQACLNKRKIIDCIKAVSDLTVRLIMNHTSKDRPKNDPFYAFRGLRFASGLVYDVRRKFKEGTDETCPCIYCQLSSDSAKKTSWAEFLVVTTTQTVYDDTECQQTSCKLWFDDDKDLHSVPCLEGIKVNEINREQGICILTFVSHDPDVCGKLQDMVSRLHFRNRKHKPISTDGSSDTRTAIMVSHPHGLSKKISLGEASLKGEEQTQKWTLKDLQICNGCVGAPLCLVGQGIEYEVLTFIYTGRNECTEFNVIPEPEVHDQWFKATPHLRLCSAVGQ